ncbi:ferredoxin reductase domain-containing protein [Echinicola rosea]|uniref:Oxidoreductase FAD/NAD(P)-binding domain-containing protein n=1 Tax=Echinicola rosea TaxID=1807691 RepID=A0ABQ1V472_9BACT|nr:hypothetical protein [Echinicola rosea]GGF36869.1 hypothetical protein GCM10011339_26730 [Echinicola rosea]
MISNKEYLRISVKRESGNPAGKVSNYLHDEVKVGEIVNIGMPSGEFVLRQSDRPVLLIAGGVGITPLLPMYKCLAWSERNTVLIQCSPNSATVPFKEEIEAIKSPNVHHLTGYSEPLPGDDISDPDLFTGFLTRSILENFRPDGDLEVYFCGPKKFMQLVTQLLDEMNIQEKRRYFEFFGPAETLRNLERIS